MVNGSINVAFNGCVYWLVLIGGGASNGHGGVSFGRRVGLSRFVVFRLFLYIGLCFCMRREQNLCRLSFEGGRPRRLNLNLNLKFIGWFFNGNDNMT